MQRNMVQIVRMTKEEISAVAKMEQEIFTDAWSAKGIEETFDSRQGEILVAMEDGKVIGYGILYCAAVEGELVRIAVSEESRSKGVGHRLLEAIFHSCRMQGVERLFLEVRESNEIARAFYEHHGFIVDGRRRRFYQNPEEDAILMSCLIPVLPTGSTSHASL